MASQELQPKMEDGSCIEVAAANSLFLNSFERWVAASVMCSHKCSSIEERASSIRKSYEMAIKVNIEFHTEMSRLNDDMDSVAMHLAMAQAYRALIST